MNPPSLHIHQMRLRVPGLTPEQGQRLGQAVARQLADLPTASLAPGRLSSLVLRVQGGATYSAERLAGEITQQILRALKKTGP